MRKALALVSFVFLMSLPAKAQTQQQPIRLKCGGSAYTDSKGQAWATDHDFSGGMISQTTGTVSGTTDPALFQNGRMPDDVNPLVYTFPVANGAYHVNLYFAELNTGDDFVGGRVFNVKTQGNVVLQNLDIFKTVGAATALIKGVDIAVTNGQVKIELDNIAGHDRGKVTAIEITDERAGTATDAELRSSRRHASGRHAELYDGDVRAETRWEHAADQRPSNLRPVFATGSDGPGRANHLDSQLNG